MYTPKHYSGKETKTDYTYKPKHEAQMYRVLRDTDLHVPVETAVVCGLDNVRKFIGDCKRYNVENMKGEKIIL